MPKVRTSVAPDGKAYSIPTEDEAQAFFDEIAQKAEWHRGQGRQIVVVQGLGFVGTAVAVVIADATDSSDRPLYFVIGVDLPTPDSYWKVARLNEGLTPIVSTDVELSRLTHKGIYVTQNLCASVSEQVYSLADVIVVDVPLDVKKRSAEIPEDIEVDLQGFKGAIRTIGRFMRSGALVIIETTVPAGACERIALPILREEMAKRNIEEPIYMAHAYERVMPGPNYVNSIRHFWRTFSGIDEASAAKAHDFLSSFIDTESYPLLKLGDTVSSETAKLLENSYRAVNIAFIYEWTLFAEKAGIDLFSVIDSIRVRKGTHDNIRLPGFGVGGYCLPKDSLLAQWSSAHFFSSEVVLKMTLDAMKINVQMPLHTFDLLAELAGRNGLTGKTIAICGVSYLPEVADTRNSPTELLVDELLKAGSAVIVHDPLVKSWPERSDIPVTQDFSGALKQADGIAFVVSHHSYLNMTHQKLLEEVSSPPFIVDAQNIISDEKAKLLHDAGCRLLGVGKGHWRKRGYQCPR